MTVYLVPAGPSRFALYSEASSADDGERPDAPPSVWTRLRASFRRAVDEGEAEARGEVAPDPTRSRFRRYITRKLAEVVAEQRLLWHLRHESRATLLHPDTMSSARALDIARTEFLGDYARHRRWLVIDALIVAVTGPVFFFVPGPNVVSWYFSFRAMGHFFSMKGARRGLTPEFFIAEPSLPLSGVAHALAGPSAERRDGLDAAARGLGLEKLSAFVERVADPRR